VKIGFAVIVMVNEPKEVMIELLLMKISVALNSIELVLVYETIFIVVQNFHDSLCLFVSIQLSSKTSTTTVFWVLLGAVVTFSVIGTAINVTEASAAVLLGAVFKLLFFELVLKASASALSVLHRGI